MPLSQRWNFGTPGRPKGALNHASRELKEFWHLFFSSEEYRCKAKARILVGDAPHLESYLLAMTYGKPRESVAVNVAVSSISEELSLLPVEALEARMTATLDALRELKAKEEALPAEWIAAYRESVAGSIAESIADTVSDNNVTNIRPEEEPPSSSSTSPDGDNS